VLRRAAGFALVLAPFLASCTEQVLLTDIWDGGPDVAVPKDSSFNPQGDAACGNTTVPLYYHPRASQLLIMFDRSSPMQSPFASTTREAAAETALINAIAAYQSRVKFGFEQFPADSSDKDAYNDCQRYGCCAGAVKVEPQNNNGSALSRAIQCGDSPSSPCPSPSGDTPTYAALEKVRDYYETKPFSSDDHYVLLVTSSEPSCAFLSDNTDACSKALSAANELGGAGIRLIVHSVGYTPDPGSCLDRLSLTGSSQDLPDNTDPMYTPSSSYALSTAVTEIAAAAARTSCTLDSYDLPPPSAAPMNVSIGTTGIQRVDSTAKDGWSFADSARTSIILSGSACDKYVNSQKATLSASYSCSTCGGSNACPWL
jgi:hypothetical protein